MPCALASVPPKIRASGTLARMVRLMGGVALLGPGALRAAQAPLRPDAPPRPGAGAATAAVLAGEVRDLAGAPLARVRVAVGRTPRAAESDTTGRFEVTDVPVGEHVVQVTRPGYEPLDFTVQVPEPGRLEVSLSLRAVPPSAGARPQGAPPLLEGVVRDDAGHPIPEVEVSAMGTDATAVTDSLGRFRLSDLSPGPYLLRFRRIGYTPRTHPARVDAATVMPPVEVAMHPQGVALAPTTVTATRGRESFAMAGFYQRKATETGAFIEREEIERRKPAQLTDLFRANTTLTVQRDRSGRQWLETRMAGQRRCVPILFVDGVYYRQEPGLVDAMAPPDQVRAVEVYYGRGTVPSAFFRPGSECGVIAVWTR